MGRAGDHFRGLIKAVREYRNDNESDTQRMHHVIIINDDDDDDDDDNQNDLHY